MRGGGAFLIESEKLEVGNSQNAGSRSVEQRLNLGRELRHAGGEDGQVPLEGRHVGLDTAPRR